MSATKRKNEGREIAPSPASARIAARVEGFDGFVGFARCLAKASVGSWAEAFAVAHARLSEHVEFVERGKFEANVFEKHRADVRAVEHAAALYAKEMADVEKIAQMMREKIAARIEAEDKDLAQALRENDPQGWLRAFDWN